MPLTGKVFSRQNHIIIHSLSDSLDTQEPNQDPLRKLRLCHTLSSAFPNRREFDFLFRGKGAMYWDGKLFFSVLCLIRHGVASYERHTDLTPH